jgi:hypothetical protein
MRNRSTLKACHRETPKLASDHRRCRRHVAKNGRRLKELLGLPPAPHDTAAFRVKTSPVVLPRSELCLNNLRRTEYAAQSLEEVDRQCSSSVHASIILPVSRSTLSNLTKTSDDNRVQVKIAGRFSAEPSAASSTDSAAFRTLELAIRKITPDVMVAPYLVVVATDARYYSKLSSNIFRFLPLRLTTQDIERMHGANERLNLKGYKTAIRIYCQFILDGAG